MNKLNIVRDMIARPYAFPGGYEKIAITSDGAVLCHKCVGDNQQLIEEAIADNLNDGWRVDAIDLDCNTDELIMCDHYSRIIKDGE